MWSDVALKLNVMVVSWSSTPLHSTLSHNSFNFGICVKYEGDSPPLREVFGQQPTSPLSLYIAAPPSHFLVGFPQRRAAKLCWHCNTVILFGFGIIKGFGGQFCASNV